MAKFSSTIFRSARIRLTVSYVLIMMMLSLLFTGILYRAAIIELQRSLRVQALRFVPRFDRLVPMSIVTEPDAGVFEDARERIAIQLAVLNGAILLLSSAAAYILAGKTLDPIAVMLDEQKRFVSDASHELRTPLTAMRTEIEVMMREKTLSSADAKKILQSNLEEIDKMRSLSDYLLKLTRYDKGESELPKEMIHLEQVIASALKNTRGLAENKNVTVNLRVDPVDVLGNKPSLIELFTILLDNAIKYSHRGESIELRTSRSKKHVIIEVQDRGVGIRAGEIPYIFNRFYRADGSRNKEHVDGFGLGLSIAKSIVMQHRGKISVESEVGKGSTFKVTLNG
ncbi:MAG: ATP-binding protein [Candidatus Woesebacteria bacterium]